MAAKSSAAKTAAAKEDPPFELKRTGLAALYPEDMELFYYRWHGDRIPLPLKVANPPDKLFFFDLHQARQNQYTQMYMWMDRLGVPAAVQRHVVETMSDAEFWALCDKWFEAMGGGATAGE